MRRRFTAIIPVLIGIGVLAFLLLGNNFTVRNNQRPGQNGTTQQGRNLLGENLQGANPNAGPNGGSLLGAGSGNNPPYTTGIGATPSPGNNIGLIKATPQVAFDGQKADNIRNQLGSIDGAKQINTVVYGKTALVGYTPTGIAKDANATRNTITNKVRQIDNSITKVIISDSRDISSRIGRLADNIKNSFPGNGFNNEYNQIVKSIKPVLK